jgi:Domain of unknown function (DUF4347)
MPDANVWAYHTDFGTLCEDAELDRPASLFGSGGSPSPVYPDGNRQGQGGWDISVSFTDLHDLALKLTAGVKVDDRPIQRGEIKRLAICAHGDQGGRLYIKGKKNRETSLSASNVLGYHSDLHTIGLYTREGSTILLMGCLAGQGTDGTALLVALSGVWPGRTVVGFSTIGYRHPGEMKRRGQPCELPGMRDTDALDALLVKRNKWDGQWNDFSALPWASEGSIHAKVVVGGVVQRCPPDELCTAPAPTKRPAMQKQKAR